MASLKYDIWLACSTERRPRAANELLERFGTSEKIFFASRDELSSLGFLSKQEIDALSDKNLVHSRAILKLCAENNIGILSITDAAYPYRLKNIYDAPVVLYYRGRLPDFDEEPTIAVVGTRRSTAYGRRAARRIGRELAEGGGLLVTGLARGIDSEAAIGALEADGTVVGVLGCGIDVIYPPENSRLFAQVEKSGVLISEYAPGTKPDAFRFPARNRIMSGLSCAVALIEAPVRSGALITADHATEQGRDVFVLPGSADSPACEGSNRLLMEGASPFLRGEDILQNYTMQFPEKLAQKTTRTGAAKASPQITEQTAKSGNDIEDEVQRSVYEALWQGPMRPDELVDKLDYPAGEIMTAITMLELSGRITQGDSGTFMRG